MWHEDTEITTPNLKIAAYELALKSKQAMPVQIGSVMGEQPIDERPVKEIAEEIYQWLIGQ